MNFRALLFITPFLLIACGSTPSKPIETYGGNSVGISILNVTTNQISVAYRMAEKHCAKYSKVAKLLESSKQLDTPDEDFTTMVYQCLQPLR